MYKNPNYQKEYREKNKEKNKQYQKEYQKKNREIIKKKVSEYHKKWYQKNKEKKDAQNRKWAKNHSVERVKYVQKYVRNNKEKVNDYQKRFGQTIEGKYRLIKHRHKQRWNNGLFTIEEFEQISLMPCNYCGGGTKKGIDRMDNKIGYTKKNSMSCCKICNYMKKAYSVEEFLNHIRKIYKHIC